MGVMGLLLAWGLEVWTSHRLHPVRYGKSGFGSSQNRWMGGKCHGPQRMKTAEKRTPVAPRVLKPCEWQAFVLDGARPSLPGI